MEEFLKVSFLLKISWVRLGLRSTKPPEFKNEKTLESVAALVFGFNQAGNEGRLLSPI